MLIVHRGLQTPGDQLVSKLLHFGKGTRLDFTFAFVVGNGGALFGLSHRMVTNHHQGFHYIVKCIGIVIVKNQSCLLLILGFFRANLVRPAGKITVHDARVSLTFKYMKFIHSMVPHSSCFAF